MMDRLTKNVAQIVAKGRQENLSEIEVASEIMAFLRKEARHRARVKPKRGIGVVTQADLFIGL